MKIPSLIAMIALFFVFACSSDSEPAPESKTGVVIPKDGSTELKTGGIMTPDGVLLNYLVAGSGKKTIIVPNAVYLADDFRSLSDEFQMIFFDLRNRGRSQSISNAAKLEKGIVNDVKDLEAIRQHFKVDRFTLVGHGYLGLVAALYAKQYPEALDGVIQISPVAPSANNSYTGADAFSDSLTIKLNNSFEKLASSKETLSPKEYCDRYWALMRTMYQGGGIGAERIARGVCRYPNEHPDKLQAYLNDIILPSIETVIIQQSDFTGLKTPVLAIHGTNDRVNPLGASKDWVNIFPKGELLSIENGGHMPWIEAETQVFNAIREFVR